MPFLKSLGKLFLKFILIIFILLVVICAGLLIYYAFTIQSAEDYLPKDFLFYVKIDSLKDIYNNVLDLKAAEVIFSQPEFQAIHNALLEFKSNEFARDNVLKRLLEMRASIVVHEDRSITVVLEPGLLSLATRNIALISTLVKIEKVNLTIVQKGKLTVYAISIGDSEQFFFSVANNLVFLSTKRENIESLFKNFDTGNNLKNNKSLSAVQGKLGEKGLLDLYVSTPLLIDLLFKNSSNVYQAFSQVAFNDLSLISFYVSNNELRIGIFSSFLPKNASLKSFLAYNPASLQSIKYFPATTSVVSSVNVKSFKDLYGLLLLFQGQELSRIYAQIDDVTKSLLGISLDDLLFNWSGEETGAFCIGRSTDPVVFIRIKDRTKLEAALKKLDESLLLDKDSSLVFNNVRLSRIIFPGIIKSIVDLFVKNLEMPYFYTTDDFIFFCMNPEILSGAINDYKSGQVLLRRENYKTTTEKLPANANIFCYYDLTENFPPFFPQGSLPARLLSLYESGAIGLYLHENELSAYLTAKGVAGRKTVGFPGFPKNLEHGAASDVLCADLSGSGKNELIYIDNNSHLVIQDLISLKALEAPVEKQSSILMSRSKKTGRPEIFVFSASGTLGKYDKDAKSVSPFPVVTIFKNSFPPVDMDDDLLFYSQSDKALFLLPKTGGKEKKIGFTIENPILSSPSASDGLIAFYPKTFEGTVYVIDNQGNLKKGWSQNGGGISYCSPLFVKNSSNELYIAFLTQAGQLNLWDSAGNAAKGFPQSFAGPFYSNPVLCASSSGQKNALALLNEGGMVTLVAEDGRILKQKTIPNAGDKKSALSVYDIDGDRIDELFIYGANNFVIGLDSNLELLPGFPVKGGRKPAFVDINLDGRKEMVVAGFDNQLYAYELYK
jgi:hypothetical protein